MTAIALFGRTATPAGVTVRNPAFDRTPARLVGAIVTEQGIHRPPYADSLRGSRCRGRPAGGRPGRPNNFHTNHVTVDDRIPSREAWSVFEQGGTCSFK